VSIQRRALPARARRLLLASAAATALATVTASCADFNSAQAPQSWTSAPALSPEAAPNPQLPGSLGGNGDGGTGSTGSGNSSQQNGSPVPPPQGCHDFNPSVIATCLDPVSAVALLPGTENDPVALAAERTSGQIVRVHKGDAAAPVASLSVDTAGDGGLTGLALSPTYAQDQLIFAYVTTPTDNRVVRIAPGDTPKPVLTGIPRGPTDNRGVLAVDNKGALLVATGDAGNPANASNPASLAGKVLRIDVNGAAAPDNPTPGSAIIASGLTEPGGLCASSDGSKLWVTNRAATQDQLYRLQTGQPLGQPAWTWPDRPGVAGCAAFPTSVLVGTSTAGNVQSLALNADGTFAGKPQIGLQGKQGFGRISGMMIVGTNAAIAGTVNKDGGTPVSSDDRVLLITGASATGGGED
jgi:glucose/arabinose dehydrogenase